MPRSSSHPHRFLHAAFGSGCILLASCSSFQNSSTQPFVPDQVWADSTSHAIALRMEKLWGYRFKDGIKIQMIAPDSQETVLDSFPMAVRRDTVVRKLWKTIGLYREKESEAVHAGRLRRIATRAVFLPRSRRILLVPSSEENKLEEALAHEMVHAMQNEVYPLSTRLRGIVDEDEMVGFLGVLEGQAEYLAPQLTRRGFQRTGCAIPETPLWTLSEAIRRTPQFSQLPPALTMPSYAPYVYGWQIVCQSVQRHGPSGMDSILLNPPAGSWQLWRPQSYFAGEKPVDWDTSRNALHFPRIWTSVGHARIGEIRLAALLVEWDATQAWKMLSFTNDLAWQGDRLWLVRKESGETAFVWTLSFRSPGSAHEFARSLWKVQSLQRGPLPALRSSARGLGGSWVDSTGACLQLSQEGKRLYLLQGFPKGQSEQLLRNARKLRQTQGPTAH